jgi:hypothetical protein
MGLAAHTPSAQDATTAQLEQRALESQARALCEQTQQLATDARSRGVLRSREGSLQSAVFDERRYQLMQLLDAVSATVSEARMARLQQLIGALEFSCSYFRSV